MTTTIYQRLDRDEFRLIKLPATAENEDVVLSIQMVHSRFDWIHDAKSRNGVYREGPTHPLHCIAKAADSYEATSYTWGSPKPTRTLVCNGQEVEMRENAYDFLQRLRLPQAERFLWMDCICINQEDDEEKATQVEMMHWIYRNAKTVLIWLGQEADGSAQAMEYMCTLDTRVCLEEVSDNIARPWNFRFKSFLFDSLAESSENKRLIESIFALVQRPWVRRVWIQQEAALCDQSRVLCGGHEVSWDQLFSLAWRLIKPTSEAWPSWTGIDDRVLEPALDAVRTVERNRITQSSKQHTDPGWARSLRDLAFNCSVCLATDPRDKVYALYNLQRYTYFNTGKQNVRPEVDYTVPWQIVYMRVARWMYETQQRDVIAMAGRCSHRGFAYIPSWVPDWRFAIENAFVRRDEWAAGGSLPPSPKFISSNPKEPLPTYWYTDPRGRKKRIPGLGLELKALMLDRIAYRSLCLCTESDYLVNNVTQIKHIVQTDLDFCAQNVPRYCTGESYEEAYAMTMIAATDHNDALATADYATNGFREWRRWLDNDFPDPSPSMNTAIESSGLFTENPFGVTAHGLMCLMPQMSRVGDYVAVLAHIRFPYVLRRVGSADKNHFELIGQCFIHQMMTGRVWDLLGEFGSKYVVGSGDEVVKGVRRHVHIPDGGPEDQSCADSPFNAKGDYLNVRRVLGPRKVVLV